MAKLTRETAKVFGATADPTLADPEIGQFGSAKAGTYNGTGDIATIQSLPAWSNGWIAAVTPTQQFPSLPERTGVDKVLSYQSAYLLQEGVPEYDAGTEYSNTSIVKVVSSGELIFYLSLQDGNIGNALSNTSYWKEIRSDGQWIEQEITFATTVTAPTSTDITYSLSTYLPNDNYAYEVLFNCNIQTNTTSGDAVNIRLASSLCPVVQMCRVQTRSSSTVIAGGACVVPIGTNHEVTVLHHSDNKGTFGLFAAAYRRIGTNG